MRTYFYSDPGVVGKLKTSRRKIEEIIRKIAKGTDTRSLVVVVSLRSDIDGWSGSFFPGSVNARRLVKMRGPWRKAHNAGVPPRLPEKFRLIEVTIGAAGRNIYPRSEMNLYGFKLRFRSFHAHLAYIVAHELHHYKADWLREPIAAGEKSADRWAEGRVNELGYDFRLIPVDKPKRPKRRAMSERYVKRFSKLRKWSILKLTNSDNRRLPSGSIVRFLRRMRNSYRALVLDAQGVQRLVPIEWLRIVEER